VTLAYLFNARHACYPHCTVDVPPDEHKEYTTMRKYKRIVLAALAAAAIAAGATTQVAGDPSQWGVAKKGSFDITDEQLAGSRGGMADLARDPAIAGSAGTNAKITRESA
jgi:hypothetical protein